MLSIRVTLSSDAVRQEAVCCQLPSNMHHVHIPISITDPISGLLDTKALSDFVASMPKDKALIIEARFNDYLLFGSASNLQLFTIAFLDKNLNEKQVKIFLANIQQKI